LTELSLLNLEKKLEILYFHFLGMYKTEIEYGDILPENTGQIRIGPDLIIFDSYPS
jgi:hypothetical protein